MICLVPSLIVGIVVGVVITLLGLVGAGVGVCVALTLAGTAWLWRTGSNLVLRSVGARLSDEDERPRLHNVVDGLCATMGLPRPTVYVVDHPVPNALSIGRDPQSASIVVTTGLVDALTLVEMEGVLAHELVHIKRHDTLRAAVAVAVVASFAAVSGSGAGIVHSLIGSGREFSADQRAAGIVRYPPGLGSALEMMAASSRAQPSWPPGTGRLAPITRWLWIDPMAGAGAGDGRHAASLEGNLDDTGVRAAALALH